MWTTVASIVGAATVVVGSLIVVNLRSIKHCVKGVDNRITKAEDRVENIQSSFATCKVDCERTFVPKEAFLRETGFQRRSLDNLTAGMNRLEGKMTVVEQLPKISGNIAREIVKELKNGGLNGRT